MYTVLSYHLIPFLYILWPIPCLRVPVTRYIDSPWIDPFGDYVHAPVHTLWTLYIVYLYILRLWRSSL
jgi:hypothetical protein